MPVHRLLLFIMQQELDDKQLLTTKHSLGPQRDGVGQQAQRDGSLAGGAHILIRACRRPHRLAR